MRRPRGPGGRFLTGDEIRALEQKNAQNGTNGNGGEGGEDSSSAAAVPEKVES